MMEAISILLFKPGYTVNDLPDGIEVQYYGKSISHKSLSIAGIDE